MKKLCLFKKIMIFIFMIIIVFSFLANCKTENFQQENDSNLISFITDYSFENEYFHSNSYVLEKDFKLTQIVFYYNNFNDFETTGINNIENNIPGYFINPGIKNTQLYIFKTEFG